MKTNETIQNPCSTKKLAVLLRTFLLLAVSEPSRRTGSEEVQSCSHLPEAPQGSTSPEEVTGRPISSERVCPPKDFMAVDTM